VSRATQGVIAVAAVAVSLLAVAFWIAPRFCEGGFGIYFLCGLGALVVVLALPFVLRTGNSLFARVTSALGLVALGAALWVAGLLAANVQFLCRLF
jgi:hypothetical protein